MATNMAQKGSIYDIGISEDKNANQRENQANDARDAAVRARHAKVAAATQGPKENNLPKTKARIAKNIAAKKHGTSPLPLIAFGLLGTVGLAYALKK